jgi:hypothetical protein
MKVLRPSIIGQKQSMEVLRPSILFIGQKQIPNPITFPISGMPIPPNKQPCMIIGAPGKVPPSEQALPNGDQTETLDLKSDVAMFVEQIRTGLVYKRAKTKFTTAVESLRSGLIDERTPTATQIFGDLPAPPAALAVKRMVTVHFQRSLTKVKEEQRLLAKATEEQQQAATAQLAASQGKAQCAENVLVWIYNVSHWNFR